MGFCVGKSDLSELRLGLAKTLQAGKANLFLEAGHLWSEGSLYRQCGSVVPTCLVGVFRDLYCIGPGLVSLAGKWVFTGAGAARSQPW